MITWHRDYEGSARQVAKLGEIAVGAVICNEADRAARQAQWAFWLPSHHGTAFSHWKYVKTEETAKAALVAEITTWLKRAGILTLAERDRVDASSLPLFSESMQKDVAPIID